MALPDVQRVAFTSNYLTLLPDFKERLLQEEFDACVAAGVDTLATIFHPCHRETCHLGEGKSFEIVNLMELVGESIGVHVPDLFKKLKIMGDVDRIVAESAVVTSRSLKRRIELGGGRGGMPRRGPSRVLAKGRRSVGLTSRIELNPA